MLRRRAGLAVILTTMLAAGCATLTYTTQEPLVQVGAYGLPDGAHDLSLVIQDRTFDDQNQFVYLPNGMRDRINGFLGDQILVNGQADYRLSLATRALGRAYAGVVPRHWWGDRLTVLI